MAYPTKDSFTFNHADQATYPSTTPAEQKANFDKRSEEMRVALNAVVAILNAVTDGASGADSLGMTAISALGASATVQSIVEALVTKLQATSANASGAEFIGAQTITGLTGNDVQTLLEALSSALTTHRTSTDHDGRYYTESEADAKYATKADVQDVVLGQIPDGSLTEAKLNFDVSTQAELNSHASGATHITAQERIDWNAKANVAVGTWADTTTSIEAGVTYTKTIATGVAGVKGRFVFRFGTNPSLPSGGTVHFTTTANDAIGFVVGTTPSLYNKSIDSKVIPSTPGVLGSNIELTDVYIDGTDLKISLTNKHGTDAMTLTIGASIWEVES